MGIFGYRLRFLLKNLLRGFFILAIIVIAYIFLQKYTGFEAFLDSIGKWPVLVYGVFIISEVVFGIIPPELFMIWSIKNGLFDIYGLNVLFLALISYGAGVLGYFLGANFKNTGLFKKIFERYIERYKNLLNRFGGFLIFVGAITPIPFSAVCMLMGVTNYNFGRFLLITSSRFLRFAVYSYIIYQAHI